MRTCLRSVADLLLRHKRASLAGAGCVLLTGLLLGVWLIVSGCPGANKPPTVGPRPTGPVGLPRRPIEMRVRLPGGPHVAVVVAGPLRFIGDGDRVLGGAESFAGPISLSPEGGWMAGSRRFPTRQLELCPTRNGTLQVNGRAYRGYLRLVAEGGEVRPINCVDLEDYLGAVVTSEMYASFPVEALKAQAIIARTYAMYEKQRHADRDYDVTDDVNSQAYGGIAKETALGRQAAADTRGIMMVYGLPGRERIFPTFYSSTCGGGTMSVRHFKPDVPEIPPLAGGVACPYCRNSKAYFWPAGAVSIPHAEAWNRLRAKDARLPADGSKCRVTDGQRDNFGRLLTVQIVGPDLRLTMLADVMRLALGAGTVRSTMAEMSDTGDALIFRNGRGFGHGVGLCQWGAAGLAGQGQSADAILRYYYPKAAFKRAY